MKDEQPSEIEQHMLDALRECWDSGGKPEAIWFAGEDEPRWVTGKEPNGERQGEG